MHFYDEKDSDYFAAARSEIVGLVPPFSQRVLDIGCGSGQTLEMLKARQLCGEAVGMELTAVAAHEARRRVNVVHCLDVEKDPWPDEGKFDLVLMLDVLEHLADPWSVLRRVRENYLAHDGSVIISLPNARHFSLVLPLLRGRFDYAEKGILDKTHLRFFTKISAVELINSAGLMVETTKATSLDLHLRSGKLNAITLGLLSGFLASQFIFRAVAMNDLSRRNHDGH